MLFTKKSLTEDRFTGFRLLDELDPMRIPPQGPGVFAILRPADFEPSFLSKSTAGTFKKKDPPNLKREDRESEWIPDASVLYIGKASAGSQGNRGGSASSSKSSWITVVDDPPSSGTPGSSGNSATPLT